MIIVLLIFVVLLALLLWGVAYIAHPTPAAVGTNLNVPVPERGPVGTRLWVGTYNIHGGRDAARRPNLDRIAPLIQGADLVALQEVHGATRFGVPDHATRLARKIGSGALFSPARTRWFREYRGNGLLTRLPVERWEREPLPDVSGHSFRVLTAVRVRWNGRILPVLHTHLHPRLAREEQLRIVFERFRAHYPAILMGDLNATRQDAQIAELLETYAAQDAIGLALGASDPADRIDWILTRGFRVHGGGMIEKGVSDHPYYWVEIEPADEQ